MRELHGSFCALKISMSGSKALDLYDFIDDTLDLDIRV